VATIEPYARVVIREFEERDAEGAAELLCDLPYLVTADRLRHRLRTTPPRVHSARWIAEDERRIVGWGQSQLAGQTERDDVAGIWVFVAPDRRRAGIGARLYELADDHIVAHGARELRSPAWEEAGHRFLAQRGYERGRQDRFSAVDPRTVDTSRLELPDGFRLVALADLAGRERDLHALYAEAFADQPGDHPLTNVPFEEWVTDILSDPELSRDGSFVVLEGDTPAALAWIKVAGKHAQHDLTGTARRYRRRGLARAAKLATVRWCAEHGIERLATGNDAANVGMLAINRELGFRPWITQDVYVLRL
jgi:GNAT superfamily N-acetyltransferase